MAWTDWIRKRFKGLRSPPPTVAVLRLSGPIMAGRAFRGLSLESMAHTIERAFELKRLQAVALVVNSPGASPVQSALIHQRIPDLPPQNKLPLFPFPQDLPPNPRPSPLSPRPQP